MRRRAWAARAAAGGTAMALLVTLAACGSSSGGSNSSDTSAKGGDSGSFSVLVYGDANNKEEKKIVKEFNAHSKVKAKMTTIPGANYSQKLQTIITTNKAPDVFYNWGGGSIQPYVKAGLLEPLTDMIKKNPKLQSMFLPSVFNTAKVDGKPYGIPMRGTQPVMLFSNKKVLKEAGITSSPKTWNELLSDVSKLKAKGKIPIALGGGDQWPSLMWLEYVYDRVAGPSLFKKALSGDKSVWESADSKKALSMVSQLIKSGAFGSNYDSVKATNNGSARLLTTGKAGFELMGSWGFSTYQNVDKSFVKTDLGYSTFPSVPGGKGNEADLVGNTNNFYSVMKKAPHKDAIAKFLSLMYSSTFIKAQLSIGDLPTTTNAVNYLDQSANPPYEKYQYNLVKQAPAFQLSWDQAYPPSQIQPIHDAVGAFFDNQNAGQFIKAMQGLSTSS